MFKQMKSHFCFLTFDPTLVDIKTLPVIFLSPYTSTDFLSLWDYFPLGEWERYIFKYWLVLLDFLIFSKFSNFLLAYLISSFNAIVFLRLGFTDDSARDWDLIFLYFSLLLSLSAFYFYLDFYFGNSNNLSIAFFI